MNARDDTSAHLSPEQVETAGTGKSQVETLILIHPPSRLRDPHLRMPGGGLLRQSHKHTSFVEPIVSLVAVQ